MTVYTLDTNIVSYLLKGNEKIKQKLELEIKNGNQMVVNPITYYEISRGLLAIRNIKKLSVFKRICQDVGIIDIDIDVLNEAAKIYANLKKEGCLIEDADIFIAAICIKNNITLISNNEKHFKNIEGLIIENW